MSTAVPDRLFLWMLADPARPQWVGEIRPLQNGDVSLTYADAWNKAGFALSADMPLGQNEYTPMHRRARQKAAPGALDDARPDAWGEKVIRYLHQPKGLRIFDTLYLAGDERFGALGVSSSGDLYAPFPTSPLPQLKDAQSISDVVKLIESGGLLAQHQRLLAAANASLGGAKPKAIISIDGEQWVLKLFSAEPIDHPLAEHATMTLAAKAGIHVAETRLVPLASENALAVKRFDREGAGRLHCVSAATVLRAETPPGEEPAYGYPHLARVLRRFADPKTVDGQLLDLFRRMVFNVLIANTDDHEKNHALMMRNDAAPTTLELTPAYDMVPTGSGATAHEFLIAEDSPEPTLANAMGVCAQFDLSPQRAALEVVAIIGIVNSWQSHFRACGVSERDIAELALVIDREDLLNERVNFDAGHYTGTPTTKRARRGRKPFA